MVDYPKVEFTPQTLFDAEPLIVAFQPPKALDVEAVIISSRGVVAAKAAAGSRVNEMDPELAAIQDENMQNGAGFEAARAEKRLTEVRAGETAAEIAQNGITRAREIREQNGTSRPPTNKERALADRKLDEATWPNGHKGKPASVPTEAAASEPEVYSTETTAAINAYLASHVPPREITIEDAQRAFDFEFGSEKPASNS